MESHWDRFLYFGKKTEDQQDGGEQQPLECSCDKEDSRIKQVVKAKIAPFNFDKPWRGLPQELQDMIYRYCFMSILDTNSDCHDCIPYPVRRPPYWLYAHPCLHQRQRPSTTCKLTDLNILRSGNQDMTVKALEILYKDRTFYFSPEDDSLPKFTRRLSPGIVHSVVRHIEVDLTRSSAIDRSNVEGFLLTLEGKFKLETLKIPVITDTRHLPGLNKCRPASLQTWLHPCVMDLLYRTLHSGSIESLHWVFNKVSCDNSYLRMHNRPNPTTPHQLSRLVHLLNERASKNVFKSLELIEWWQKALDRKANGTRTNQDKAGRYEMTTFAEWESDGVLMMRPRKEWDSDQATLDALRKIKDIKLGYDEIRDHTVVFLQHQECLAANDGSALLR